jgi:nitrogen fixation protein NifZ
MSDATTSDATTSDAADAQGTAAPRSFRHLSAAAAWDLLLELGDEPERLLVLDVRDGPSFARSHLDGATHFDQLRLPELLRDTPRSANIVVYCYHGHASQMVAGLFGATGFVNAFSVEGGFEALAREHAQRSSPDDQPREREPSAPARRFIVGDCVYAREAIENDGGMPDLPNHALVAAAGARGVIVQVGHTEADPRQTLYAVRFEDAEGHLGAVVGCLPEELLPAEEQISP